MNSSILIKVTVVAEVPGKFGLMMQMTSWYGYMRNVKVDTWLNGDIKH